MASSTPLIRDLFQSRNDLYFQPTQADQTLTVITESERSLFKFFKCGSVQAPFYGFRNIFVQDTGDRQKNSMACSMTLSGIIQQMRSHVAADKSAAELFKHPDQNEILERVKDDNAAIENLNGFAIMAPDLQNQIENPAFHPAFSKILTLAAMITMTRSFDRREHNPIYFETDPTYRFRLVTSKVSQRNTDEFCCQIPIKTALSGINKSGQNVTVANAAVYDIKPNMGKVFIRGIRGDLCPELCEFVKFLKTTSENQNSQNPENFPQFSRAL